MMSTLTRALQEFQKELRFSGAEARIGRAAGGSARVAVTEGGIAVHLVWPSTNIPPFCVEFPSDRLVKMLGGRYHPTMRICRFIKESIQAALQHRGV